MTGKHAQLGELEIATLEVFWSTGRQTAKSLVGHLESRRPIATSTAQTTLERLHHKGLLARDKQSHAYVYQCRVDRRELLKQLLGDVIDRISGGEVEAILSSLLDYTKQADEVTLSLLEAMIARHRKSGHRP